MEPTLATAAILVLLLNLENVQDEVEHAVASVKLILWLLLSRKYVCRLVPINRDSF